MYSTWKLAKIFSIPHHHSDVHENWQISSVHNISLLTTPSTVMYMKIGKYPQYAVCNLDLFTYSFYSDVHENWQIFPLHKFTIGLKVHCWPAKQCGDFLKKEIFSTSSWFSRNRKSLESNRSFIAERGLEVEFCLSLFGRSWSLWNNFISLAPEELLYF